MSIVAERPVKSEFAAPVSAGLLEEVERQEREDDARGPEMEPEASLVERVGRLAVLHHRRLVRYVHVRVEDWPLAEDLVQDMWAELTRRPGQMRGWAGQSDASLYPLLTACARRQIYEHLSKKWAQREMLLAVAPERAGEVMDWLAAREGVAPGDVTYCAVEDLLLPEETAGELSACWAHALESLTRAQRVVVERFCEGAPVAVIAEELGLRQMAVRSRLSAAVRVLRDPEEVAKRLSRRLPEGWEALIDRLPSPAQAEVVRMWARGMRFREIAQELGISAPSAQARYQRGVRGLWDLAGADPVGTRAAGPQGPVCARTCQTGCHLRAGAATTDPQPEPGPEVPALPVLPPELRGLAPELHERLASLSAVEQDILLLRCAGVSEDDVAHRLAVKPKAVKVMLRRLSAFLAELLEAAGAPA
ncbi:sigma factor-like helix-turn-helix DNA-binding protein [Streptomyces sp. NPDC058861]|uniref:sigma factor-like helix-turn-helix DNA-binding protein n=1 Tax=Streptomyces sp. NPDC058861 TaxID=3346653 RepID=UPI003687DE5D